MPTHPDNGWQSVPVDLTSPKPKRSRPPRLPLLQPPGLSIASMDSNGSPLQQIPMFPSHSHEQAHYLRGHEGCPCSLFRLGCLYFPFHRIQHRMGFSSIVWKINSEQYVSLCNDVCITHWSVNDVDSKQSPPPNCPLPTPQRISFPLSTREFGYRSSPQHHQNLFCHRWCWWSRSCGHHRSQLRHSPYNPRPSNENHPRPERPP